MVHNRRRFVTRAERKIGPDWSILLIHSKLLQTKILAIWRRQNGLKIIRDDFQETWIRNINLNNCETGLCSRKVAAFILLTFADWGKGSPAQAGWSGPILDLPTTWWTTHTRYQCIGPVTHDENVWKAIEKRKLYSCSEIIGSHLSCWIRSIAHNVCSNQQL